MLLSVERDRRDKEGRTLAEVQVFTGLGDGRAKVQRLVDHIKASLLADAAVKSDAALTDALDALDTTKSISSDDLKRIATNFKVVHADAIAKSDAMRTAKAIVDGVVEDWARKDKSVVYDPTNLDYMKKLALYAARPVIDKAAEYGDDNAMLVKALERYMGLLNQAVGVAEHICQQGHLGYPRSSQSAIPGRGNGNTHDGAAGEGDGEGLVHAALTGGVCGADVCLGGDVHADVTGEDGE